MEVIREILAEMLDVGDFSDLTLSCQGYPEFKVHKAIVCAHSPVLKAALKNGFKEAQTGVYEINGFNTTTVWCMVQFMYKGDYSEAELEDADDASSVGEAGTEGGTEHDTGDDAIVVHAGSSKGTDDTDDTNDMARFEPDLPERAVALLGHIRVNSIGDYFGIHKLVSLANVKIQCCLDAWIAADLPERTMSLVASLPSLINLATTLTGDKQILDILASATATNINGLLSKPSFQNLETISTFAIRTLHHCNEERKKLRAECNLLKSEVALGRFNNNMDRNKWSMQELQLKEEILRLKGAIEALNNADECRNNVCDAEFKCYINLSENFMRCVKCRCKHYAP